MRLLTAIVLGIAIGAGIAVLVAARDQEQHTLGTAPNMPMKEA
jgi:multisubunit Na+/H+ antiporter MnhC subunit